jgi:hypothetical protein
VPRFGDIMWLHRRHSVALAVLGLCAACSDAPTNTRPPPDPDPKPAPTPVGVYELHMTGIGTDDMRSNLVQVRPPLADGVSPSMTNAGSGIVLEQVSSLSFIDGVRNQGGQRYVSFTYRVRNGTGVALNNLTMVMAERTSPATVANTPFSSIRKFDGTDAGTAAIAPFVVPAGAVVLGTDFVTMHAVYPDVLQVFTEAEVAAVTLPAGVTALFPYGYMVRSALTNTNRTLAATADPNQFDGLLTVAFRIPLQATGAADVFAITFNFLAVTDTETRLTESIEESQDTAAVRRLRDRATSLAATTVTILNGSPVADAAVADYPGQRQICSPRTAGTAASPTNTIVSPGGYAGLMLLTAGESVNSCLPYFRGGTASRPATNVPFAVTVKAMDRYGNVKTAQADTVHLDDISGPAYSAGAASALVSGSTSINVTYTDYGQSLMAAIGRRLRGNRLIPVAGVTRTWTAGAGTTDWHTNNNWSPAAVPMSLDSVLIPVAAPLDPVIAANVIVEGVTVEDVATISLNAFDLTANANVSAGLTGGITNTTGRLILAGTARTVQGRLPRVRVTGTYSLTGNVNSRAPIEVLAGRLTNGTYRLQADGY